MRNFEEDIYSEQSSQVVSFETGISPLSAEIVKMSINESKNFQNGLSEEQKGIMNQQMRAENDKVKEAKETVYDMMEDYQASDVRKGNVGLVHKELEKIQDARSIFRGLVRNYKRLFAEYHPQNCQSLDAQFTTCLLYTSPSPRDS